MKPLILVVEDDQIVALDLKHTLRTLGYEETVLATTGQEAIDIAVHDHPGLILMDIRLEGPMDGIHAAASIQAQVSVPVVFITAHGDDATVQRALALLPGGYIRFVRKPFDEATIKAILDSTNWGNGG